MRSSILRFSVLSIVVLLLALVPKQSAATPDQAIEARLISGEGDASRARVHVIIHQPVVTEVQVVAFNAEGAPIGCYSVEPRYDGGSRAEVSIDIAPDGDAKIGSARIAGFTMWSSDTREPVFDTVLVEAVPMTGCVGFCIEARRDCSNSCWTGSGEAVFSCGPDGNGGCVATCRCCEYPDCNGP